MMNIRGCGFWIRDLDGVAAFRCGDKSNKGIELCDKCKQKDSQIKG